MRRIALALVLVFVFSAAAHTDHSGGLPEVKATPGSFGYGLMQAQEAVSMTLTFDQEKKAEKRLKFARKRLAVAKRMAEHNDTEKAGKAMQQFGNQIGKARTTARNLPEEKRTKIEEDINRTTSTEVLNAVLEKVPEQARKGIMTALDAPGGKNPRQSGPPVPGDETEETGESSGFTASGSVVPASPEE